MIDDTQFPLYPPAQSEDSTEVEDSRLNRYYKYSLLAFSALVFFVVIGYTGYVALEAEPASISQITSGTGNTTLAFSPSSLTTEPLQDQIVDIKLESGSDKIAGADLTLTYDPDLLSVSKLELGEFLPIQLIAPKLENGQVKVTIGAPPDSGGKTGSGTIARLTLQLKTTQAASLVFAGTTEVVAIGTTGSVVKSATDLSINPPVAASVDPSSSAPTPTPTPTSSPSPSPSPTPSIKPSVKPTVKPTPKPSLKSSPSPISTSTTPLFVAPSPLPSSNISLNDVFKEQAELAQTAKEIQKPNFFEKILLGWQAIFSTIFDALN